MRCSKLPQAVSIATRWPDHHLRLCANQLAAAVTAPAAPRRKSCNEVWPRGTINGYEGDNGVRYDAEQARARRRTNDIRTPRPLTGRASEKLAGFVSDEDLRGCMRRDNYHYDHRRHCSLKSFRHESPRPAAIQHLHRRHQGDIRKSSLGRRNMSTSTPANSQSTSTTDLNPQINDLTHRSSNPWTLLSVNGTTSLSRTFHFRTFASAFSFMTDVAALCKKHKHHPEWSNTYNVVFVRWTTHAAGSTVGEKDVLMAGLCDGVAEEKGEKVVDEAGAGEESGKGKGMAGLADSAAGVGAECCGGGSGGGKNGVASVNEDTEGAERLREKERIESVERTEGGQGGLSGVGGQPS